MFSGTATHRAPLGLFADHASPRLYDRLIEVLRVHHYSRAAEKVYVHWIGWYLQLLRGRHPRELSERHVNLFLSHIAVREQVAASTQNQALAAARLSQRLADLCDCFAIAVRSRTGRGVRE
jgi:hypothetical protein